MKHTMLKTLRMSISSLLVLLAGLCALMPFGAVQAEGSWQMGLFEGLSNRQPMRESTNDRNFLRVDILNVGEVINILACGTNNSQEFRVQIVDPAYTEVVFDSTAVSNVDCDDDFNHTFDPVASNAVQFTTTEVGTYWVYLTNVDGTNFNRYDITVTDNLTATIDPRIARGRLWADYWYFAAGAFTEARSTDADLYVVADGGFINTYSIWKLDLTNFAGHGYGLKANDIGVRSPNQDDEVVAGISVPTDRNDLDKKYPIYLGYPEKNFPRPGQGAGVSDLRFSDSTTTDNAITASGNGTFEFETDITSTAIYEIIIDVGDGSGGGPDGLYGFGDIYLRGVATPGTNTVPWDGKDNNGEVPNFGVYNAKLSVRLGEFHFVADDVETSGGPGNPGVRIYKVATDGTDSPTTVYWDDKSVMQGTEPDAFNQTGIYEGDHNWGNFTGDSFGDRAYIDTYAFADSVSPNPTPVAVVEDDTVLISIVKSFTPDTIPAGDPSNMQFEIAYTGTIPQTGITVTDTMPEGMTLLTAPGSITVTGAGCSGFTFGPDTVVGGSVISIIDGNIDPDSVCIVSADVTGAKPGELVNQTSGVSSNENDFGVPSNYESLFITPGISGTPFACDATMYESEVIGSSTRLYEIGTAANPFTRTEFSGVDYSPATTYRYDGLAYNPNDGYLYGIVTESDGGASDPDVGSLVRIDQEGKVVNLGLPIEGPNTMTMPVVSDRFVGGTMTANGNYVVVTDNSANSYTGAAIPADEQGLIIEFDLTTSPPEVLFNWQHNRDVGDIAAHPDGRLISQTENDGLITIDSETGNVDVIGGLDTWKANSLMTTSSGLLYAHTGDTGDLWLLDADTGAIVTAVQIAGSSTADGASCSYGVGMQKTVSLVELETDNSAIYELEIYNGSNSAVSFDLIDNLQDVRYFVAGSLVSSIGGTVNAYDDTNLLNITGATLGANSVETVQFEVMYPVGVSGGPNYNQAEIQISGQPSVLSDYPTTFEIGDATPIEVIIPAAVGISKRAQVSGSEVTYWFNIVNTGEGDLTELTLSDDLDAVFGAGNYSVVGPPVLEIDPGTITVNTAFDGSGDAVLIDETSGSVLVVGERAVLRITVDVTTLSDMGLGFGVYSNQVDVFALGLSVTDLSVDGDNVDPNGDNLADEQSPTVVSLAGAFIVSGIVFEDNGMTSAHNGVHDLAEKSLGGVTVELRDSAGAFIDSTETSDDGSYEIVIPMGFDGSQLQIVALATPGYIAISEAADSGTTGSVVDSLVTITPNSTVSTNYKVDFGRVRPPSWLNNNIAENSPGAVVLHPHQYRANTSGVLTFSYAGETSSPVNPDFSAQLFLDSNCNGVIENNESEISSSLALTSASQANANCTYADAAANGGWGYNPAAGNGNDCPPIVANDAHLVCVVNKVIIPANAANNDTYSTSLAASFDYADDAGTGHGVSSYLELVDITRTIVDGEGVLVLYKWVQNLTTSTAKTKRNEATPDDALRYTVDFNNNGTGAVTEVMIADSTPAYSVLDAPLQCPPSLPDGTTNCQVLVPSGANNVAGYSGPVRWLFDGALPAGGRGTVSFDVRVE